MTLIRNKFKLSLLALLLSVIPLINAQINFQKYNLLFEESFNQEGKPSSKHWMYRINEKMGGMSVKENVEQGIGDDNTRALIIKFTHNPNTKQFIGGGVVSTHNFGYGYYEARVKLYGGKPELAGLHQSFWSMGLTGTNEAEGKGIRDSLIKNDLFPQENRLIEIDGFELDSKNSILALNYHIYSTKHQSGGPNPRRKEIDINKWITVGYEWLPERINFYIDGQLFSVKELTGIWNIYAPQNVWFTALPVDVPHWGGLLPPPPNSSMQVDYFRFYAKSLKGVNRLGNADFEYGDETNQYPISWIAARTNGYKSEAVKVISDSTQAYNGNRFLTLENNNNPKSSIKQIVEFIPNGKYILNAYIKTESGGEYVLKITDKGKIRKTTLKPNKKWRKITIKNIDIVDNNAVIEFSNLGTNKDLHIDNVTFEEM